MVNFSLWDTTFGSANGCFFENFGSFRNSSDFFSNTVLFAVTSGSFRFCTSDTDVIISENSYVLCPPLTLIKKTVVERVSLFLIHYNTQGFAGSSITGEFNSRGKASLEMLKSSSKHSPGHYDEYKRHLMCDLWYSIASEKHGEPRVVNAPQFVDDMRFDMSEVIGYINSHLTEPLTLDELASRFGYSQSYMNILFKKYTSMTPRKFIMERRISYAKSLLSDSSLTVRSISEKCGWNSEYYFCNAFKKAVSMTPTEYRLLCGKSFGETYSYRI